MGERPPCFTEEQWSVWIAAEMNSREPVDPQGFCSVCTPQFQRVMRIRGECRHPRTKFIKGEDGWEGMRTPEDRVITTSTVKQSAKFRRRFIPILGEVPAPELRSVREQLLAARAKQTGLDNT
jgi:hypothetical protein